MVNGARRALRSLCCATLLALLAGAAVAATVPPAATDRAADPWGLRDDLRAFVRLPRTATPRAWEKLGASVLAVGALAAFDESLRKEVDDTVTPGSMRLARDLRPLGQEDGLALLGGAWGLGRATGNPRLELIGEDGLEATVLAAGLLAPALKQLSGRARPRQTASSRSFHLTGGDESFPSGEATEAFAIAAVVSTHAEHRWVKATARGLATAVGLGRMELDALWASVVAAGALLGAGVGHWVARRHPLFDERAASRWEPDLVAPAVGKSGGMLYVGWTW
jgi:undecaprenyl-diphosphatase